jgi:hypothetical protein
MAKATSKFEKPQKEAPSKFPSRYGSHQSMVDASYQLTDASLVVCVDEEGPYVTERWKLDSGLADLNRSALPENRKERLQKALNG